MRDDEKPINNKSVSQNPENFKVSGFDNHDNLEDNLDPYNLSKKEKEAEGSQNTSTESGAKKESENAESLKQKESPDLPTVASGLTPSALNFSNPKNIANLFLGSSSRRKNTAIGTMVGILIGGALFGASIISGPAQLIQLSQNLKSNFRTMENEGEIRTNNLLTYATAKDVGETRLGVLGRLYLRSTLKDLSDAGITIKTNSLTGSLEGGDVDTKVLSEQYPELKGMSVSDTKNWLSEEFEVETSSISLNGDGTYNISTSGFPTKSVAALKNNFVSKLGDGNIETFIKARVLSKYLGITSLFHPISRSLQDKYSKLLTKAQETNQVDEDDETNLRKPIETQADVNVSNVENSTFNNGVVKALTLTAGMCLAYTTADDVVAINEDRVVLPSVAEATNLMAVGDQLESGQDISSSQVGAISESLSNSQGTVWGGTALEATEGTENPKGVDIPDDYKQAFSNNSSAANIRDGINSVISDISPLGIGAGTICSTAGTLIQLSLSVGVSAFDAFSEIATFGADTPLVAAQLAGYWGLKEATNVAEGGLVMHLIQSFILNKTTDAVLAKDAFSGPVGGDLLSYGARAAAGITAIAGGGVPLSNSNTTTPGQGIAAANFEKESFFARMFNPDNSRSLLGHLSDNFSPNLLSNVSTMIGGFGGFEKSLIPNLAVLFTSKTSAAQTPYDWGFPIYAIPANILDSSQYANPYANADQVATLFDSSNGSTYINMVNVCFGDNIYLYQGKWDVETDHLVNPESTNYSNTPCNNTADPNWQKVMMFVFDTTTLQSIACYQGDDQSCQDLGYNSGGATDTSATSGANTDSGNEVANELSSASAQKLAQDILNSKSVTENGTDVTTDLTDAAAGKEASAGTYLSRTLLAMIYYLSQDNTFNISALESGGQGHSGPGDPHYEGDAVDITHVDGDPIANSGIGRTANDQKVISEIAPLMPLSTSSDFYHESGFGQAECGTTPPLPKGIVTFDDTCSHLHIQVPVGTP